MAFKLKSLYSLLTISILLSGCELKLQEKLNEIKIPLLKRDQSQKKIIEKKTVFVAWNKGQIEDYKKQGWEIIKSETEDITCTWKTKRAKRGCNLDKDKGCRITIPDQIGKRIKYSLEREIDMTTNK